MTKTFCDRCKGDCAGWHIVASLPIKDPEKPGINKAVDLCVDCRIELLSWFRCEGLGE